MTRAALLSPALSKEIRALLPLWGASVAALGAAFVWRGSDRPDIGLFAYVVGSLAIGAQSVGQEYTYRTLPMLLSQPSDRRRVYLRKFVVSAVMLLTLAALAGTMFAKVWRPESARIPVVVLPLLCGLFLAPLLTMTCRGTLAGMILSGSVMGLTWFATLAIAWFGFGIDPEAAKNMILGRWTLGVMVLCPLAGLLGWRRFTTLEGTESASPALHLPRWLRSAQGARRHSPLQAVAIKEVHLQQMAFVVAGLYIIGWALSLLAQRYIPSWSTFPLGAVMLLYCIGLAIMIGALASADERQHGTLDWQLLQPAPVWQQWMVKVGLTLGLAVLFGVGLPVVLNELRPLAGFRALRMTGDLVLLIVLLTASSLYISSLSSSGVRAMVLSLPAGLAVAFFVQIVSGALRWMTSRLAGPLMADIVTGAAAPPSISPAEVALFAARPFSLMLVFLLLWFGFVNHRSSERTIRRMFQQVASIALLIATVIVVVGAVLAFYELRSRYVR
jgi:ABC-type transport system involved in multi-copper enzyme maturation permease subunit